MSPEAGPNSDPLQEIEANTENVQLLLGISYDMNMRGSAFSRSHPYLVGRLARISSELGVPELADQYAQESVIQPDLKTAIYSEIYGPGHRDYYDNFAQAWLETFGDEEKYISFAPAKDAFVKVLTKAEDKTPLLELCIDSDNAYLSTSLMAIYAGEAGDAEMLKLAAEECRRLEDSTDRPPSVGFGDRMKPSHVWRFIDAAAEKLKDRELAFEADGILRDDFELENGFRPDEEPPTREGASPAEAELNPSKNILEHLDEGRITEAVEATQDIKDIFLKAQLFKEIYLTTEDPQYLKLALISLSFEDVPDAEVVQQMGPVTILDPGENMIKEESEKLSRLGAENKLFKEVDELPFVHGALVEAFRYVDLKKAGKNALAAEAIEKVKTSAQEGQEAVEDLVTAARITGLKELFDGALEQAIVEVEENYGFEEVEIIEKGGIRLMKVNNEEPKDIFDSKRLAKGIRKLATDLVKAEGLHGPRLRRLHYAVQCVMHESERGDIEEGLFAGLLDAVKEEPDSDEITDGMSMLLTLSGVISIVPRNR